MVDSEYSMDIYTFAKISIGTVMRNPEMLKICFLIILRLKKCVSAQMKDHLTYCDMLLINMRLNK